MKEVAITINEKKGEVENFAILVNIYNRLEPKIEVKLTLLLFFFKINFLSQRLYVSLTEDLLGKEN